nr:hypothetical protein [Micromonospora kangleipakensis]
MLARYVHNDRLIDALGRQAFAALKASPGARAYYDQQRHRGIGHHAALRQLGNRLVGILHGCLKTGTTTTKPPPGTTAKSTTKTPPLDRSAHGMSVRTPGNDIWAPTRKGECPDDCWCAARDSNPEPAD